MSYEIQNNKTYQLDDGTGERTLLANFVAIITNEIRHTDGQNTDTSLTLEGKQNDADGNETTLAPITISAPVFAGMGWVMSAWGVKAVIQPGGSIKEALRTQIQVASNPKVETVYRHIGWTTIDKKPAYIHAGGAITAKGNDPSVSTNLPKELSRYNLSAPDVDISEAIQASLRLAVMLPPEIGWTLLAATLAPVLGQVDFAVHLTGRTGTFKSEIMSLFQSHYGAKMDARHLPGSWSSTPNAIEAQAYYAANAPFVVDDFVPTGTSWQQRAYQTTADKIIRSQGNQSGRARLTDTSNLQTAMYPRGIVLSTGEDTPEGHSVRARMMILELTPGDVTPAALTVLQKGRPLYPATVAAFIQYVAGQQDDLTDVYEQIRNENLDIGHTRTPAMVARLLGTIEYFLDWANTAGLSTADAVRLGSQARAAINGAAQKQQGYLETADPCDMFLTMLRQLLAAGTAHARTMNGGIPKNPTALGWTQEGDDQELPTYKSHGPCIGWVDWNNDELHLDATSGYAAVKKIAGAEMNLSKPTMLKRLKENGNLKRVDDARQRNTIRVTAENHPRQCLCMSLTEVLDTQEVPE